MFSNAHQVLCTNIGILVCSTIPAPPFPHGPRGVGCARGAVPAIPRRLTAVCGGDPSVLCPGPSAAWGGGAPGERGVDVAQRAPRWRDRGVPGRLRRTLDRQLGRVGAPLLVSLSLRSCYRPPRPRLPQLFWSVSVSVTSPHGHAMYSPWPHGSALAVCRVL